MWNVTFSVVPLVILLGLALLLGGCTEARDIRVDSADTFDRSDTQCVGWCRVITVLGRDVSGSGTADKSVGSNGQTSNPLP